MLRVVAKTKAAWEGGECFYELGVEGVELGGLFTTVYTVTLVTKTSSAPTRTGGGRRGTGCVFLFVKSNVKVDRVTMARSCLSCGTKGLKNRVLLVSRFPCFKATAGCSTGGCIASSSTSKATVTYKIGTVGCAMKMGTSNRPIGDMSRRLGRSKCRMKVVSAIPLGRTAPTSFCTGDASEGSCCNVDERVVSDECSFFTKSNFVSFGKGSGGRRPVST